MKKEDVEKYYRFELDEESCSFLKDYPASHGEKPLISEEEMKKAEELLLPDGFPPECFDFIRRENEKIFADKGLNRAARFLRYMLFEKREAWQNSLSSATELFATDTLMPKGAALLMVIACAGYSYLGGRILLDGVNAHGLHSTVRFTKECHEKEGYWGMDQWRWNLLEADGSLYRFNTLNFQPNKFNHNFMVLFNGKEYVSIIKEKHFIAQNGALTAEGKPYAVESTFAETAKSWIAHRILDNGYAELIPREFSKSEWQVALQKGDIVLGYHIPANTEYTPEQHRISMNEALDFFRTHHPEHHIKGMICTSWLYSPQNVDLFPADSKILAMERCVHLIGLPNLLSEKLMFLREGSSLHRRVVDYLQGGHEWHNGYCYVPYEQAVNFGEWTHE